MGGYWDLLIGLDKHMNPSHIFVHSNSAHSNSGVCNQNRRLDLTLLCESQQSCLLGRCEVSACRTGPLNDIRHEKCTATVCRGAEWDDASY